MSSTVSMREALESGRVTYTRSWLRDCCFYLCNNHILLSVFLAHPEHPYGRLQRGLVLFNSLAFAFFITAVLNAVVPVDLLRAALHVTIGTLLQLAFDLPASMLGTCPCAHKALPSCVQGCCRSVALACLACHTCMAFLLGLLGALALAITSIGSVVNSSETSDLVWDNFVNSKLNAFVGAVPWLCVTYALLRWCEANDGGKAVPLVAGHEMV